MTRFEAQIRNSSQMGPRPKLKINTVARIKLGVYNQESMYEAWERYKDLLRKCLHHELPGWLQIQTFYNGLRLEHRAMVDATAGGSLMRRTPEDAYGLLDDMAFNAFSWNSDRSSRRPPRVHNISTQVALAAQVEAL